MGVKAGEWNLDADTQRGTQFRRARQSLATDFPKTAGRRDRGSTLAAQGRRGRGLACAAAVGCVPSTPGRASSSARPSAAR